MPAKLLAEGRVLLAQEAMTSSWRDLISPPPEDQQPHGLGTIAATW
jgi:hypothetical protein